MDTNKMLQCAFLIFLVNMNYIVSKCYNIPMTIYTRCAASYWFRFSSNTMQFTTMKTPHIEHLFIQTFIQFLFIIL